MEGLCVLNQIRSQVGGLVRSILGRFFAKKVDYIPCRSKTIKIIVYPGNVDG